MDTHRSCLAVRHNCPYNLDLPVLSNLRFLGQGYQRRKVSGYWKFRLDYRLPQPRI